MKRLILILFLLSSICAVSQNMPRYELVTASGTNTYTATIPGPALSLVNGLTVRILFTNANSGASTLQLNGQVAMTLRHGNGDALVSGDIPAGTQFEVTYNGTASQWRLSGNGSSVDPEDFWNTSGTTVLTGDTEITGAVRLDLGTTSSKLSILTSEVGGDGSTFLFTQSHGGITRRFGLADGIGTILDLGSDVQGDMYQRNSSGVLSRLPSVATGNALISGGVGAVNSWGKIGLTTHVSGTLPVANGGTGITSLGTGVATALGVNVGSAGAVVVNGGALGTPSSGTGTNLTGIPESGVTNLVSDLAGKQGSLTLTTTGSSGAATLISNTLNIPQYSGGPPVREEIGELYHDVFNRTTFGSNYTLLADWGGGGIGQDYDAGKGTLTVYTASPGSGRLQNISYKTNLEKLTRKFVYGVGGVNAESQGLYFGVVDSWQNQNYMVGLDFTFNGVGSGPTANADGNIVWRGTNDYINAPIIRAVNQVAPQNWVLPGDSITATITQDRNQITASFYNHRTKFTNSDSYTIPSAVVPPATTPVIFEASSANFSAWVFAPTGSPASGYFVYSDSVWSTTLKGADLAIVGNSIEYGFSSTHLGNSLSYLLQDKYGIEVVNLSKSSNRTSEVNVAEVLALEPEKIYVGSLAAVNLISSVGDYAATETAYANLITQFVNAGYPLGEKLFINLLPPNFTAYVPTFNDWVLATYPLSAILDLYQPFNDGSNHLNNAFSNGDGIHLNNDGVGLYADLLAQKLGLNSIAISSSKKAYLDSPQTFEGSQTINGNLTLSTLGNHILIKTGSGGWAGQTDLVGGTKAVTVAGVTTGTLCFPSLVAANTTTLTSSYQCACTSNTVTLRANVAAGTINTADISTLNYLLIQPAP